VPPTGAKGLNLAVNDVRLLGNALAEWYSSGSEKLLDSYSTDCLRRIWRAEHFSWWMTTMLHRPDGDDPFDLRMQESQLRYVTTSKAAATTLAENYVGL
jgi:p-hydroxybenzoate 3-monooxygenase